MVVNAAEIVVRLFGSDKGVTAERLEKAKGLAQRNKVEWQIVLNAMSSSQRLQVDHPHG